MFGIGELMIGGWALLLHIGILQCAELPCKSLQDMMVVLENHATLEECQARADVLTQMTVPMLAAAPTDQPHLTMQVVCMPTPKKGD